MTDKCPMTDAAADARTLRVYVCPFCTSGNKLLRDWIPEESGWCQSKWHDQPTPSEQQSFDFRAHLQRQREWSEKTFGPGKRTAGVCDHIRKELGEIEADPEDISEWVDVAILALDGAWRAGYQPQQIIDALVAKQTKNEGRKWPDWRTMPTDKAIEHDRSGEPAPAAPVSAVTNLGEAKDMQSNPDKERRRMDDPVSATPRTDCLEARLHAGRNTVVTTLSHDEILSNQLEESLEHARQLERELAEAKLDLIDTKVLLENINHQERGGKTSDWWSVSVTEYRAKRKSEARAAELQGKLDVAAKQEPIGHVPKDHLPILAKQSPAKIFPNAWPDGLPVYLHPTIDGLAAETARAHNAAIALVCGNANLLLSDRQKQCVLEMKVPQ